MDDILLSAILRGLFEWYEDRFGKVWAWVLSVLTLLLVSGLLIFGAYAYLSILA